MAQYEFTAEENRHIDQVRRKLQHIALLFLVLGVLQLVGAFMLPDSTSRWISVGGGILLLALGWLFWRPIDNFRRITTTAGQDIREVITAIKDLRAAYFAAEIILIVFAAGIIIELMRLTTGKGL
jgi:protein-S-isoprenylcysteine O-methyltransferase Ste14